MSLADDVLVLIDRIHAAGLEPERWQDTLAAMGQRLNAVAGVMYAFRPGEAPWNFSTQYGFDPAELVRYNSEFNPRDNPVEDSFARTPVGSVTTDPEHVPKDQFHRTRFYNEWVVPQGIAHSLSLKAAESGRILSGLSWVCSAAREEFDHHDIALAKVLGPHVMRAVETARRIGALEGRLRLAEALLDTAAEPVVLVNADARLVHANAGAHTVLARRDGLVIRRGILGCGDHEVTARLHACVRLAARGRPPRAGIVAVRRASARPYSLMVTPMPVSIAAETAKQPAAAILIGDPDGTVADRAQVLRAAYNLTSAEAQLVDLLVREDLRIGDAADRLGVTVGTARSQLHQCYVKTGTRGQSELLRLVLLGLPNPRR